MQLKHSQGSFELVNATSGKSVVDTPAFNSQSMKQDSFFACRWWGRNFRSPKTTLFVIEQASLVSPWMVVKKVEQQYSFWIRNYLFARECCVVTQDSGFEHHLYFNVTLEPSPKQHYRWWLAYLHTTDGNWDSLAFSKQYICNITNDGWKATVGGARHQD